MPKTRANTPPNKSNALPKFLEKKSASGVNTLATNCPNVLAKSVSATINCSIDFCDDGIVVSIEENFLCPSSITALTKACRFSNFVKELVATFSLAA